MEMSKRAVQQLFLGWFYSSVIVTGGLTLCSRFGRRHCDMMLKVKLLAAQSAKLELVLKEVESYGEKIQ
jgi:hypothetical protein